MEILNGIVFNPQPTARKLPAEPRRFDRLSNKETLADGPGFSYWLISCKTEKLLLHATADQGDTAEAKKGSQSRFGNCRSSVVRRRNRKRRPSRSNGPRVTAG